MNNEEIIKTEARPQSNPDRRTRGVLQEWNNSDYKVFAPYKKSEVARQTVLREKAGLKLYKNEGEKENSYSLHVNVKGDDPNPEQSLFEKVYDTLKDKLKKEPKLAGVKFLYDTDAIKIWKNNEQKVVKVLLVLPWDKDDPQHYWKCMGKLQELNVLLNNPNIMERK